MYGDSLPYTVTVKLRDYISTFADSSTHSFQPGGFCNLLDLNWPVPWPSSVNENNIRMFSLLLELTHNVDQLVHGLRMDTIKVLVFWYLVLCSEGFHPAACVVVS